MATETRTDRHPYPLFDELPAAPRRPATLWCVGGGKGGVGKSILSSALAWQLAREGKRVVAADLDLGGANLHTFYGLPEPKATLADFVQRRLKRLEDAVVETGSRNLRLLGGGGALLTGGLKASQRGRLIEQFRKLDADVVMLDLGAGTTPDILDFFVASDVAVLVVVPEPTSVENGYRFLQSALYRRLREVTAAVPLRGFMDAALERKGRDGIRNAFDLADAVEQKDAGAARALRARILEFRPHLVVNQARTEADAGLGRELAMACRLHLGIEASCAGVVHSDEAVWQSVRRRRIFLGERPSCVAAEEVRRLTNALLKAEPAH